MVAELEKRRKLGLLGCEQLFYYMSAGGREIDVLFERDDELVAVEIKSTTRPGPRDASNLRRFAGQMERPVRSFLFYPGREYLSLGDVQCIPVAAIMGGA